jgi:hypothetical protein
VLDASGQDTNSSLCLPSEKASIAHTRVAGECGYTDKETVVIVRTSVHQSSKTKRKRSGSLAEDRDGEDKLSVGASFLPQPEELLHRIQANGHDCAALGLETALKKLFVSFNTSIQNFCKVEAQALHKGNRRFDPELSLLQHLQSCLNYPIYNKLIPYISIAYRLEVSGRSTIITNTVERNNYISDICIALARSLKIHGVVAQ